MKTKMRMLKIPKILILFKRYIDRKKELEEIFYLLNQYVSICRKEYERKLCLMLKNFFNK